MLDINDIMWYCSEIRHQIEKKRFQTVNNPHPLLKYVRSVSLPTRTTQAATTTTSAYSFSNVMSTVDSFYLIIQEIFKIIFRLVHYLPHEHIHHHQYLMFNNNLKWNVLK
jgi:hypothetical protein